MGKKKLRKKYLKKKTKAIRHFAIFLAAILIQRFFSLLPYKLAVSLGGWLGRLSFYLLPEQRKRILDNLSISYNKAASKKELKRIALDMLDNAGRGAIEVGRLPRLSPEDLKQLVKINNPHYLVDAYKDGHGAIGLTAHFGNWELLAAYISQVLKLNFRVIARPLTNKYLDHFLRQLRQAAGVQVIFRETGGLTILRCLKRNIGIGILADQDTRGQGVFVEFLGQPSYTQIGPAKLAIKLGTPIVPVFIHRDSNGLTHTIDVEPPLSFALTNNENENIKSIIQSYTQIIEDYIKKYPTQWMWMHRRWKHKPANLATSN